MVNQVLVPVLVLVLVFLSPALCCDWLRHFNHYSKCTLTLLQDMGGPLSQEDGPVPFPYKEYTLARHHKVESQLLFIRNSLTWISELYFHHNASSVVSWDSVKTEHFLVNLHRLKEEMDTCVGQATTKKLSSRRLRRYYRKLLRNTVYRTGGSAASWELIRKETQLHLHQLQLLVASILDPSATSRGRRSTPQQN